MRQGCHTMRCTLACMPAPMLNASCVMTLPCCKSLLLERLVFEWLVFTIAGHSFWPAVWELQLVAAGAATLQGIAGLPVTHAAAILLLGCTLLHCMTTAS